MNYHSSDTSVRAGLVGRSATLRNAFFYLDSFFGSFFSSFLLFSFSFLVFFLNIFFEVNHTFLLLYNNNLNQHVYITFMLMLSIANVIFLLENFNRLTLEVKFCY